MISNLLHAGEYHPYYESYINKATSEDILDGLQSNLNSVIGILSKIPTQKENYAYAEGKWSIKDVLLHIVDAERVFAYRALRIARGDNTPLAGFEQDDYVISGNAKNRSLNSIAEEYKAVRHATIALFRNFEDAMLLHIGMASGAAISVRALGYIITGHENHHIQVIKERYL